MGSGVAVIRAIAVAILLLFAAGPAAASAGFWCDIDDDAVLLSVEGGLSRGIPGPPFNFVGSLAAKLPGVPADFREVALTGDDLAQSWFDADEVRLQIYRERAEGLFASVDLVIETVINPDDELSYAGRYTLVTSEMAEGASEATAVTATGVVTCSAG
jgi:hypothetical protein